ncbi:hypothetical protein [Kineococcus sp. SYSU DK005]|uniref:hypothetical protein n=1 Tax=Kineococcus sp. SYSU DK005 TaxID=3383126 RepID=UPI003D7ECA12
MQLGTVLATVIGALVGLLVTLLTNATKWYLDRGDRWEGYKKEAFTDCLAAFNVTQQEIFALAVDDNLLAMEGQRGEKVRAAFAGNGLLKSYELVLLLGEDDVGAAAETAFQRLRGLRDKVAEGRGDNDPKHKEMSIEYAEALSKLRKSMRKELRKRR